MTGYIKSLHFLMLLLFEPHRERKPDYCLCENKGADTAKLICPFVFATRIVQFLYFLNPKFPASSHLLCLYRPVCVGPGRKPRRPFFSRCGSFYLLVMWFNIPVNSFSVGCGQTTASWPLTSTMGHYRDQPWFSVFKHSMDHEKGV